MSEPSVQEPIVSPEFIVEQSSGNLVKSRQKPGPQTRSQRRKRRAEVYRLHFQEGWPAIRIAEVLHVDRNTVNSDLKILYDRALNDYNPNNFKLQDYIPKTLFRLESQRDRLSGQLVETKDPTAKIAIERLISDIDFRLFNAITKVQFDNTRFWDVVVEKINELAESEGLEGRYTNFNELTKIPKAKRKMIDRAIEEETGING